MISSIVCGFVLVSLVRPMAAFRIKRDRSRNHARNLTQKRLAICDKARLEAEGLPEFNKELMRYGIRAKIPYDDDCKLLPNPCSNPTRAVTGQCKTGATQTGELATTYVPGTCRCEDDIQQIKAFERGDAVEVAEAFTTDAGTALPKGAKGNIVEVRTEPNGVRVDFGDSIGEQVINAMEPEGGIGNYPLLIQKVHNYFCQLQLPPFPGKTWYHCAWARTTDYQPPYTADKRKKPKGLHAAPWVVYPWTSGASIGNPFGNTAREKWTFYNTVGLGGFKVIHDLDDTFLCSGGSKIELPPWGVFIEKGIDTRIGKHEKYPGVGSFFRALELGVGRGGWKDEVLPEMRPTPMSARPDAQGTGKYIFGVKPCDPFDFGIKKEVCGCPEDPAPTTVREKFYGLLKKVVGQKNEKCKAGADNCNCFGMETERALYGDIMAPLSNDFQYIDQVTTKQYPGLAYTKYYNWHDTLQKDNGAGKRPYRYIAPVVFVGDNGQGDLQSAQQMLVQSKFYEHLDPSKNSTAAQGRVVAAFIHDVREQCPYGSECWKAWSLEDIYFFGNYLEAAQMALAAGLIKAGAKEIVAKNYQRDLASLGEGH